MGEWQLRSETAGRPWCHRSAIRSWTAGHPSAPLFLRLLDICQRVRADCSAPPLTRRGVLVMLPFNGKQKRTQVDQGNDVASTSLNYSGP